MAVRLPAAVRRVVVIATVLGLLGCGHRPVRRVVRFAPEPGTPAVETEAPKDGIYRLKYATTSAARRKDLHRVDDAAPLFVRKGERVGFYADDDGRIMAYAAGVVLSVDKLPHDATFCLWTYRDAPRKWDVGEDLAEALRGLGMAVVVVGAVALAAWAWYYDLTHPDDDCGCDDAY
jgi:hypothetical protein